METSRTFWTVLGNFRKKRKKYLSNPISLNPNKSIISEKQLLHVLLKIRNVLDFNQNDIMKWYKCLIFPILKRCHVYYDKQESLNISLKDL